MLFAKNSDRQRNEAQSVEYFARAAHPAGAQLQCTYIRIAQVPRTHAVLICRPFWLWGAEIGANEHGVVIGNETLHSRAPAQQEPALIGMDLVRLALERAATAAEAVQVMTQLLERHGQGGDCGHMVPYYYNNGFLIADPREAFVLETIGREWLLERVRGIRSISNCFSIDRSANPTSSAGLPALLKQSGWAEDGPIDYAEVLADREREQRSQGRERRELSHALLSAREGKLELADFRAALRHHGPTPESQWNPREALPYGLCVHAGMDTRSAQTTGALISELRPGGCVHWVTGSAAPCISVFKPVFLDGPLPIAESPLTGTFDKRNLWWRHEQLHRRALRGHFPEFLASIREERDGLEARFEAEVNAVRAGGSAEERARVVARCWQQAMKLEERWSERLGAVQGEGNVLYRGAWAKMNRAAGMEECFAAVDP